MSPVSQKQKEYNSKFIHENYEQLSIRLKKGERERYKAAAAALDMSVNQLFINAVEQYISDNIDRLSNEQI